MNHKDRFFATINYERIDHPAFWLGLPTPAAEIKLLEYFRVHTLNELKTFFNDDIYTIDVPYNFPPSNRISHAFKFAKVDYIETSDDRTLTVPGFFEDYDNPADVDKFDWPDPEKYLDREESRRRAKSVDDRYARMGIMWSVHFMDVCAAFGMEKALMNMLANPDMFSAVINKITDFYLHANELFYEATKGYLDAVLIGNDFGTQQGLLLDVDLIRNFIFPGTKRFIDQAKSYGLKVMHHSCGSIFPIIDDLIKLGVDVIHPIQAMAKDMDVPNLKKHFGGKVAFCGGVDTQYLLVNSTPEQVTKQVRELIDIFPTGLIISPSHEALLPDVPPENVLAIFNAKGNRITK